MFVCVFKVGWYQNFPSSLSALCLDFLHKYLAMPPPALRGARPSCWGSPCAAGGPGRTSGRAPSATTPPGNSASRSGLQVENESGLKINHNKARRTAYDCLSVNTSLPACILLGLFEWYVMVDAKLQPLFLNSCCLSSLPFQIELSPSVPSLDYFFLQPFYGGPMVRAIIISLRGAIQ